MQISHSLVGTCHSQMNANRGGHKTLVWFQAFLELAASITVWIWQVHTKEWMSLSVILIRQTPTRYKLHIKFQSQIQHFQCASQYSHYQRFQVCRTQRRPALWRPYFFREHENSSLHCWSITVTKAHSCNFLWSLTQDTRFKVSRNHVIFVSWSLLESFLFNSLTNNCTLMTPYGVDEDADRWIQVSV